MYVSPFLCGIIATILAEVLICVVWQIYEDCKKRGSEKDDGEERRD